jgi:hypothetical protein
MRVWPVIAVLCLTCAPVTLGQTPSAPDIASSLGLTGRSIAAAGLTGSETQLLLQRLHNNETGREAYQVALIRADTAARAVRDAEQLVRADPTAEASRVQLRACRQEMSAARSALRQRKAELLQTAATGLSAEGKERLLQAADSRRKTAVTELGVVSRTDAQWTRLRIALAAERQATASGQSVGSGVASLLQAVRAETEVVAARIALETNLAGVTNAIATFGQ